MVLLDGQGCCMPVMPGLFLYNKELLCPNLPVIQTGALLRSPLQGQCTHPRVARTIVLLLFHSHVLLEHCLCCRELPCPRLFLLPGGTHRWCLAERRYTHLTALLQLGTKPPFPYSFLEDWLRGLACYPKCRFSLSPILLPGFITGVSPVNTYTPVELLHSILPLRLCFHRTSFMTVLAARHCLIYPLTFQMSEDSLKAQAQIAQHSLHMLCIKNCGKLEKLGEN